MAAQRKRIPNAERKPLTRGRLFELLHYDPETGTFMRLAAARPQSAHYFDKPIGYIKRGTVADGGGYHMINVDGRVYRAHRLAWFYMTGAWPDADVDHKDGNRANNRWGNLRAATRSQNIANSRRPRDSLTGVKGVTFDKGRGKWVAQIGVGMCDAGYYNTKFLGRFDNIDDAAAAYREAAEARFGEFARTE